MTQDALSAALLEARVPRYTSYPPANRFGPGVGAATAARWLSAVPPGAAVSLYIHVPFCRRLCFFCACRTQGTRSDAPIDRYLDHLEREMARVAALLPEGVRVARLHLGGGTPTILSPDRIDRMADALVARFSFASDTEVSVEIDPCDCDTARLDALLRMGLSRVSVGVQDFDPRVQATIGRVQSVEATAALVHEVRARGVASVNFDLVYGLPHQTEASLDATLDTVLDLAPERLALFGYAHVPWVAKRQRVIPEAALPDPDLRLRLAARARERLEGAGHVPIGIDHFARPGDPLAEAARSGRLRRNFQGYTTDDAETLIGLGPSAISSFPQGIAQNAAATGDWMGRIGDGDLATARGHVLSPLDRVAAEVIERLMCEARADLGAIARRHAVEPRTLVARAERALSELPGLGTLAQGVLTAAEPATLRLLASYFDPGFAAGAGGYSQAS